MRTAEGNEHRLNSQFEQGKTLIMVTHNQEIARRTSRMIEISDGQIVRDEYSRRITL